MGFITMVCSLQTYIVHLGSNQHGLNPTEHDAQLVEQSHYELMKSVLGSSEKAHESVLYNYNKVINGFAASLTEEEVEKLKCKKRVMCSYSAHFRVMLPLFLY